MKRFWKYALFIGALFATLIVTLALSSKLQYVCLSIALKCYFKNVEIVNYKSNCHEINMARISVSRKQFSLEAKEVSLKWNPWSIVLGKGLDIDSFKAYVNLDLKGVDLQKGEKAEANFLTRSAEKKYSFLQYLRLPLPVRIKQIDIWLSGHVMGTEMDGLHITLENLMPGQTGELKFSGLMKQGEALKLQTKGKIQATSNAKGVFQTLKSSGHMRVVQAGKKLPTLTYSLYVKGSDTAPQEHLKLSVHYGQANDFIVVGESLKTVDHAYTFTWQGVCDHSLLKVFLDQALPTLSFMAEGEVSLNKKTNVWNTHTYISAWGKRFEVLDPGLSQLPSLNLKMNVDAELDSKKVTLKQYNISLKEKGAQRLFFALNGAHAITYNYATGFEKAEKTDVPLLELNVYEIPFELFNPYLQKYDCKLRGSLDSGMLSFQWSEKKNHWEIATLQPIYARVIEMAVGQKNVLTNTLIRCDNNVSFTNNFDAATFKTKIALSDTKFTPFFKLTSTGMTQVKEGECTYLSAQGDVYFDYYWGKDMLKFDASPVRIRPDLLFKSHYDFEWKPKEFLLKNVAMNLTEASGDNQWLSLCTSKSIEWSNGTLKLPSEEGLVLTVKAQNCPLDCVQYEDLKLTGSFSCDSEMIANKGALRLISKKPCIFKDLTLCWKNSEWLNRLQISGMPQVNYTQDELKGSMEDFSVKCGTEGDTLLSGRTAFTVASSKLSKTDGSVNLNLDLLKQQPFANRYPDVFGRITSNWNLSSQSRQANAHVDLGTSVMPLGTDVKLSYETNDKQEDVLKTRLELRNNTRTSDFVFNGLLNKDKILTSEVTSQKIYLDDVVMAAVGFQKLYKEVQASLPQLSQGSIVPSNEEKALSLTHQASKKAEAQKYKMPIQGTCSLKLKSVVAETPFLQNFLGNVEAKKDGLLIKDLKGQLCQGSIGGEIQYLPQRQEAWLKLKDVDLRELWQIPAAFRLSLSNYCQLAGKMNADVKLSGFDGDLDHLRGICELQLQDGSIKIGSAERSVQPLLNVAMLITAQATKMTALNFLSSYARDIPFTKIDIQAKRLTQEAVYAKTSLINDDLAFYTDSKFSILPGKTWREQPFVSNLHLNASRYSPLQNYLRFDEDKPDELGYFRGPAGIIDGTLGKPNYSRLLNVFLSRTKEKEVKRTPASMGKQLLDMFL